MKNKKILILSSGDVHGAYEAAFKMAKYLNDANYQTTLLVKHRTKSDKFIVQINNPYVIQLKRKILSKIVPQGKKRNFDSEYFFFDENENKKYYKSSFILNSIPFVPDIIFVGMTDSFISTKTLLEIYRKTGAKIFMITTDMFPLTGGCHYAWDCIGYKKNCTNCPACNNELSKAWVAKNFLFKASNIKKANIKILTGSGWTLSQAEASYFFRKQKIIHNINSLIDTKLFNNKNRSFAKTIFELELNSKVIFTGSWNINDKRKGISYFLDGLQHTWNNLTEDKREEVVVLIAGESQGNTDFLSKIPFKKKLIPYINDYRLLVLAYQASDIFVCASIEDSGPMMVSEALACGTPVVGFNMGVVSNMVINGYNGYVAKLRDSYDLGNGLKCILNLEPDKFLEYSNNAVKQVEQFSSIESFIKIFDEIIKEEFPN